MCDYRSRVYKIYLDNLKIKDEIRTRLRRYISEIKKLYYLILIRMFYLLLVV